MDRCNLPDFEGAIRALPLRNRRASKPSGNRASEIGAPVDCLRRLTYCRTHWVDRKQPDDSLMGIFQTGNEVEQIHMRNLIEIGRHDGFQIIQTQKPLEWRKYQIVGHCEGLIQIDGRIVALLEIKSVGQRFNALRDLDAIMAWRISAKWYGQCQLYMFLEGIAVCDMHLVQKNNVYNIRTLRIDIDYDYGEMLIKRAEIINAHIAAGTLPDKSTDLRLCLSCDFAHVCLPDIQGSEAVRVIEDDDVAAALTRMRELDAAHAEYEACQKQVDSIKAFLPEASADTYQQVQMLQTGEHVISYVGQKRTTKPSGGNTSYFWKREAKEHDT